MNLQLDKVCSTSHRVSGGVRMTNLCQTPYTLHTEHGEVIRRLRSVVVAALQGNALNVPSLRDIVDFMRKHDEQFTEFRHSATYKLFEPPIFENKKKACGYFSNSQRVERSE